jgi:ABC-type transport system involved in multi-copper enzyme maturation permease subunit
MTTAPASQSPARPRRFSFRPLGNPVVLKELRGRMRGARAFVVISVYLALMSGFTTLLYVINAAARDVYGNNISSGQIGRVLFAGIVGIELFLVTFIAPAFTAGAISGERERQTYDLLRTTLLPARALVVGKMISALAYIMLLLLAAIPLQSIAFLFGGVTEIELILAFIILAVTAIALGSVGLYFSARTPRTLSANVMTYGAALFITIGVPLIAWVVSFVLSPWINTNGFGSLPPAVQIAATYLILVVYSTNPLMTAFQTQAYLISNTQVGVQAAGIFQGTTVGNIPVTLVSPWIIFSVIYLTLSVILIVFTIRRVRKIDT